MDIAQAHDCPAIAIVLETPLRDCIDRALARTEKPVPERAVRRQHRILRQQAGKLRREGFARIRQVKNRDEADAFVIHRSKARSDRQELHGPFDIIGDVHGCFDELVALLHRLGYGTGKDNTPRHPEGRTAIFLGDLVDRGPGSDRVLDTVIGMTGAGSALCLLGNHEAKLERYLMGRNVTVSHGLAETIAQLKIRGPEYREQVVDFLKNGCAIQYLLDDGKLAVAHAGVIAPYQNRNSRRIRDFCLYGQTDGERDEWDLPVRMDWAQDYRGAAAVVYGHTPTAEPRWVNNTICVDTGCVFGGRLTALRYPERELVSVPAQRVYYEAAKPSDTPAEPPTAGAESPAATPSPAPAIRRSDKLPHGLELTDIRGPLEIDTAAYGRILIPEARAAAALETVSRHTMDPRWLIYLPPTMTPASAMPEGELLEHPEPAFAQYLQDGVNAVICETKHMGSRGVMLLGRSPDALARRFGLPAQDPDVANGGVCYTRTGRRFFTEPALETAVIRQARQTVDHAGLWERLQTDWLLLDCEIMPWSLKAQGLLRQTYAPVGAAAQESLHHAGRLLQQTLERIGEGEPGADIAAALSRNGLRQQAALRYRRAYGHYCWDTGDDPETAVGRIRIAPFCLLAADGQVYADAAAGHDHRWHMSVAETLAQAQPQSTEHPGLFQATEYRIVNTSDAGQTAEAADWWLELTGRGGEGMVVKPLERPPDAGHNPRQRRIQPAVKVRGKDYLSIIYGPEYDLPDQLERMRRRYLHHKQNAALRENALGLEGLRRFVDHEPLYRTHQCVFGVLALETEPLDPRL